MFEILITFKVVSLVMHTLLPVVLPLLETFLESFLSNHFQLGCRVPHNVVFDSNRVPFSGIFSLGNSQKSQGVMSGD